MTYDDWVKAIKRGFKKKETLDDYSEDTHWYHNLTVMSSRIAKKGEKCQECGKKIDVLFLMAAGSIKELCRECCNIAEDKLIEQCPACYLDSFEEYKEWKKKQDTIKMAMEHKKTMTGLAKK